MTKQELKKKLIDIDNGAFITPILEEIWEDKIEEYRAGYNQAIKDFRIKNDFGEKSL